SFAPRPRAAGAPAAAGRTEECLADVVEAAEAGRSPEGAAVAAHVVARALLRVAQHVVRVRHELEALGRVLTGIDVGVQLSRQAPVRLLDVVERRVLRDAEDLVVVSHFRLPARDVARGS